MAYPPRHLTSSRRHDHEIRRRRARHARRILADLGDPVTPAAWEHTLNFVETMERAAQQRVVTPIPLPDADPGGGSRLWPGDDDGDW